MKMRAQNKKIFKRVLPWSGVVVFFLLTYVMITYDASQFSLPEASRRSLRNSGKSCNPKLCAL